MKYSNIIDWSSINKPSASETKYETRLRNKLKALYDGNLDRIFKIYGNSDKGSWYSFINDSKVLDIVTPTQSDIVARTLNTIVDLMYSDATIERNSDNITIDTLKYLEKVVHLNGEAVIIVDYIPFQGRVLNVLNPDDYDVGYNALGVTTTIHTYYDFDYDDTKYRLENIRYVNRNIMEFLVYEQIDSNKKAEERNYHELNKFWHILGEIQPVYEVPDHKFVYHFFTEYKFKKIVPLVEVLDEALTYTRLATRLSTPTTYIPEDIALTTIDGRQKTPADFLKDRMCGFTKIMTIDDSKQKVDVDNPGLHSEEYQKVYAMYQNEILSTIGLSSASINSSVIDSSNPSLMVSTEREKLSVRTRNSLIQERTVQLKYMFSELFPGNEPEINFANFGSNIEPNLLNSLNAMINNNNISKETALKLLFPHWDERALEIEKKRLKDLEEEHIKNAILIAGHGQDMTKLK